MTRPTFRAEYHKPFINLRDRGGSILVVSGTARFQTDRADQTAGMLLTILLIELTCQQRLFTFRYACERVLGGRLNGEWLDLLLENGEPDSWKGRPRQQTFREILGPEWLQGIFGRPGQRGLLSHLQ